ncbi:hypothetical protein NFI96_025818 [Prochilodus magdalenae]|nr:hypothetical protein NFI96_025818 [Prochilodus magdalenae]
MPVSVIDGRSLEPGMVSQQTRPINLQIGQHSEQVSLLLIIAPELQLVLGFPWLQRHNPRIDWLSRSVVAWGPQCQELCLKPVNTGINPPCQRRVLTCPPSPCSIGIFRSEPGFHPQSNGQTERVNQDLERTLHCLASSNPASWSEHLIWAEYAHNTLWHSSLGMSPFKCQFGYAPPMFPDQEAKVGVPSAAQLVRRCRRAWQKARTAIKLLTANDNRDPCLDPGRGSGSLPEICH